MTNTYVVALIESLEKKIQVLKEIREKNAEQAQLLKADDFSFDKFDDNVEEKGLLIIRLDKLDEGFSTVYTKVKEELDSNREAHAEEIKKMQALITEITDLSAAIEAEEARNKASLEAIFKRERGKIKSNRSSVKALQSYSQAMNFKK